MGAFKPVVTSMSQNTTTANRNSGPGAMRNGSKMVAGMVSPKCTIRRMEAMKGEKNSCPYSLNSSCWHLHEAVAVEQRIDQAAWGRRLHKQWWQACNKTMSATSMEDTHVATAL